MRALRPWFPTLLLFCSAPLFGQGSGFFQICNSGKVAVDAYMTMQGQVTTKHIAPSDCDYMIKGTGGFADGMLGFAFADAKGQWRGARRGDLLPFWEDDLRGGNNFSAVKRTQTVQHGGASVTIPMIVAFRGQTPTCGQPVGTSARANLPFNATATQRRMAEQADQQAAQYNTPICTAVGFQLTVTPYTDSGEIGYDTQCDSCTAKQVAAMTPEEKAAEERRVTLIESQARTLAAMPGVGGLMMRTVLEGADQKIADDAQRDKDRAEIAKGPWAMTWAKYSSFVSSAFGLRGTPSLIANRHIIMRGTISRLELPKPGAQTPWIHVYFKDTDSITKRPEEH